MSQPTVSVIIPAYNCAALLRQAVGSVRRQSYQDFEVIVVDDGSTDETWSAIRSLAASWDKLRPLRCEHGGLAAARNRGIEVMRGEWIALLDADDLWMGDKLQRCMDHLAAHPDLSIVYTPMIPIRIDGAPMRGHSKPCRAGPLTPELFQSIFIHDPAVVFHKRVIEQCGGFDESLPVGVGQEFWLRVSTKFQFGLIEEPLALRRWHERSLTRADRVRSRRIRAALLERFYSQQGGRELIPQPQAFRRLARVHYGAGKALLRQGRCRLAGQYLAKAVRYNPANLKACAFYLAAQMARLLPALPGR